MPLAAPGRGGVASSQGVWPARRGVVSPRGVALGGACPLRRAWRPGGRGLSGGAGAGSLSSQRCSDAPLPLTGPGQRSFRPVLCVPRSNRGPLGKLEAKACGEGEEAWPARTERSPWRGGAVTHSQTCAARARVSPGPSTGGR